jgi:MFS-type transporter involved in bile tolerance (Atg22 family)
MAQSRQDTRGSSRRKPALEFILLLGLVSALGDITYETGRSISGPYLAFLGASAATIGWVSGLGEFLGYALRLASGYVAGRTRAYWAATFIGYGLILCIPLLAYTHRWEAAVLLFILERIGKAIRSPSRDTMLSHATYQTGRGWGFALHEALDQVGAVIGPLIFTAAFLQRNSYRDGFSILWIPAILTMAVLLVARLRVPAPQKLEDVSVHESQAAQSMPRLPRSFWLYGLFTFLSVAGFANFQVISYHLVLRSVVPTAQIPILYAVAMGVDGLAALLVGKAYDREGLKCLVIIPFVTLPLPFLAFSQHYSLAVVAAVLWGVVMATHETIMRAGLADFVPASQRAFAYGIFNTIYGAAWFVGGAALGLLYDLSGAWLVAYVVVMEGSALLVFPRIARAVQRQV